MSSSNRKNSVRREPLTRTWDYPPELPVSQAREEILAALGRHQVLILCGATGSGKSTQLPKFCLEAGRGTARLIAHTQPRRIAARALAERVAEEINEPVGQTVGWQVRFKSVLSQDTRVKLMTDGLLLSELRSDPQLKRYDTVIIDEAHERSLNIDFLLGYLRRLMPRRPDLRIVITSATLDAQKFSAHFDHAPIIDVPGRSYPVELRYREPTGEDINQDIAAAAKELWRDGSGDILVFLPGEREIREAAEALGRDAQLARLGNIDILPLFARLGSARQQAVFHPKGGRRRVILATNVAETSLTVPGIAHVIDTGTARISRYNPRSKIQHLDIEDIAQANADQRKGRCGRTGPGVCIRLYSEDSFAARPLYTDAEIQRTNLASVLLQMADLGLGEPEDFPFIDAPHSRYLSDARRLLAQLQALRADGSLTKTGRKLARLPLDPRFGRMLIAAQSQGCLEEMIPLVAVLSMQDPRERPAETRAQADQAQAVFRDKRSDALGLLNIWQAAQTQRREAGAAEFRRWCTRHHLNARRMQEWRDLVKQIRTEAHAALTRPDRTTQDAPAKIAPSPPRGGASDELPYEAIHTALLAGLIDHIGQFDESATRESAGNYRGPRGARWRIHPESALAKRQPPWIVAAEIVSTRRTYARVVAHVQAAWIERAAAHLLQKTALEPAWDAKRGEVMAREQVSLFGLILSADRKVPYSRYAPEAARQLFIEQALVAGRWGPAKQPAFLRANLALAARLRDEENRLRSRAILRSDEELVDWYGARLPADLCGRDALLGHIKQAGDADLHMAEDDLRDSQAADLAMAFPSSLRLGEAEYRLQYVFDPGSEEDGVNLDLPLAALNQIPEAPLDYLVPGLLAEKIETILRGLPKAQRRRFVPIADTVTTCLDELGDTQTEFYPALALSLQRRLGQPLVSAADLRAVELPARLRLRLRVRDTQGKLLAAGRDLEALRDQFAEAAQERFSSLHDSRYEARGLTRWSGPDLPETIELRRGLMAYPCLKDAGDSVDVVLLDNAEAAGQSHVRGLLRLMLLSQQARLKPLAKSLPNRGAVQLRLAALPATDAATHERLQLLDLRPLPAGDWLDNLVARAVWDCQVDPDIRSRDRFEQHLNTGASQLNAHLHRLWQDIQKIAEAFGEWQALALPPASHPAGADLRAQLQWLFAPGWVSRCQQLDDLARYLKAMAWRAQRIAQNPAADSQRMALVAAHQQRLVGALDNCLRQRRTAPQALLDYRWMIEEYRVSLFAQPVGARGKVSEKRLQTQWQAVETAFKAR